MQPSILQLAGVGSKRSALLVALLPAGVNAAGTLVGLATVERFGRRCCVHPCPARAGLACLGARLQGICMGACMHALPGWGGVPCALGVELHVLVAG